MTATSTQFSSNSPQKYKLLDQVRNRLRVKNYAYSTEKSYIHWIRRYILFHNKTHPMNMGTPEIEAFVTHLAIHENVSPSTQNQALCALLFLYNHVLHKEIATPQPLWAKKSQRLPVVLTRDEAWQVIDHLPGRYHLIGTLLYGTGMRLMECLRLRVKDIDFGQQIVIVRQGKGDKDRITMLPGIAVEALKTQLSWAQKVHEHDLSTGYGAVFLPNALQKKYPNANKEWIWQYVFPADKLSQDPRTGETRRHHVP